MLQCAAKRASRIRVSTLAFVRRPKLPPSLASADRRSLGGGGQLGHERKPKHWLGRVAKRERVASAISGNQHGACRRGERVENEKGPEGVMSLRAFSRDRVLVV
jgi:hypothetical protein